MSIATSPLHLPVHLLPASISRVADQPLNDKKLQDYMEIVKREPGLAS